MTCQQRKAALAMAIDLFEKAADLAGDGDTIMSTAEGFFQFLVTDEATEEDIAAEFATDGGVAESNGDFDPLWACITEDSHGDEVLVEPYTDAEGGWIEVCIKDANGAAAHQYSPMQARQLADVLIEAARDAEAAAA